MEDTFMAAKAVDSIEIEITPREIQCQSWRLLLLLTLPNQISKLVSKSNGRYKVLSTKRNYPFTMTLQQKIIFVQSKNFS